MNQIKSLYNIEYLNEVTKKYNDAFSALKLLDLTDESAELICNILKNSLLYELRGEKLINPVYENDADTPTLLNIDTSTNSKANPV